MWWFSRHESQEGIPIWTEPTDRVILCVPEIPPT
jgi:hypothetical protein